jgi:hypothetical protein
LLVRIQPELAHQVPALKEPQANIGIADINGD